MLTRIRHTYAYLLICGLAIMSGCGGSSPTEGSDRMVVIGRLERGSIVQVAAFSRSDTVSTSSLAISVTPADGATIGTDGTITLLRVGSLTVQAKLPNGKTVSGMINVAVPPSIVFDLAVDGSRAIYKAALDGQDLSRISSIAGTNVHPTVAGNLVVFTSFRNGRGDLYSVLLTDNTEHQITELTGNSTEPALSPDGRKLAFIRDSSGVGRVWISSSDGTGPIRLTNTGNASPEASPAWARDGRLVFTSTEIGSADFSIASANIPRVVTLLSGANSPSAEVEADWNTNGTKVAFVSTRSGSPRLYVLEVASGITKLVGGAGDNVAQPTWLGDGRIVFSMYKDRVWSLAWVDPEDDGGALHTIPIESGDPRNPAAVR